MKVVSDYTRLNFGEVWALDIFEYWGYLHDAVVWNCERKGETGREYLTSAYNHSRSEPDRAALRSQIK
jgi:hypothetical protein